MNDLNTHYRQLLGLSADWDVVEVDLDLSANRVTIDLQHAGGKLCCPECDQACSRADTAHDLMASAVQRGLERRETDNVKHVGIDEKSFGSGHSYVVNWRPKRTKAASWKLLAIGPSLLAKNSGKH